ncbi:MAG TPA: hypothetical protein VFJ97_11965 [Dermatophilaceae bacterium]|nr:hypothetical protein [Dermatophilaceae bacterium]
MLAHAVPRLRTDIHPLRRGPGSVQLGQHQDTGLVVEGLTDDEVALLQRLGRAADPPSPVTAELTATLSTARAGRLAALLGTLRERRLLAEPDGTAYPCEPGDPRRRRHQIVVVSGAGALPETVAELLRAGGVGQVQVGEQAADALDFELRHDPVTRPPDLVVLLARDAVRAGRGEPWRRRGVPHLPVVAHRQRLVVGPLVSTGGPCLGCLDRHRADRDQAWPLLLDQLAPEPGFGVRAVEVPSPLAELGSGIVAMVGHAWLDGQPVPQGLSIEVGLPWPGVDYRQWQRHPRCHCVTDPSPGR